MKIDSIKNGIVLDHITAGKSLEVYKALGLDKLDCSVAIIKNVKSNKMGKKDILKIDEEKKISRVQITIHEGKNRQVRKMCESIGKKVLALHRCRIGNLDVKDLKLGEWRYLSKKEVENF